MRLIDADDLAEKIMMEAPAFMDSGSSITKALILAMVKTRSVTPTIDAVQVVRCKDCIHFEQNNIPEEGCGYCILLDRTFYNDNYCGYGEKVKK